MNNIEETVIEWVAVEGGDRVRQESFLGDLRGYVTQFEDSISGWGWQAHLRGWESHIRISGIEETEWGAKNQAERAMRAGADHIKASCIDALEKRVHEAISDLMEVSPEAVRRFPFFAAGYSAGQADIFAAGYSAGQADIRAKLGDFMKTLEQSS